MLSLDEARPARWVHGFIVGVTLLAPTLAGSTELWAIAVLAAMTGSLFLIAPPHRALPLIPTILLLSLLLLACSGFLPASWSSFPRWRLDLIKLGADLPPTRSAQPWLTFQWTCLLFLVLTWSYYLFSFQWTRGSRERALIAFAIGVLILATVLIVSHVTGMRVPFWPEVPEYGFFPNRNQTSNLLGIAGIVIYALAFQRLQERRPTWWVWLCSLSIICWALILNYSRAGIILFFAGAFAWHLWWLFKARERRGPLIALAAFALLLGILFLNGGKTLQRFEQQTPGTLLNADQNGRLAIFHDALNLSSEAPFLGIGLANFRSLFSAARHNFVSTSEAVHPESDWLWGAVELGWGGPLVVLLLIIWWIANTLPFSSGTARALRVAGLLCGLAFAVHASFDVSAHRLGTLWPALFLASTSLNPHIRRPSPRSLPFLFRAVGFCLLIISGSWFASVLGHSNIPTTAELARLEKAAGPAIANEDYDSALQIAESGLRAAPLDWLFYHQRGLAEAALHKPKGDISGAFRIARYLLPNWPELYLKEGLVWLASDKADKAFETWQEGMTRLGKDAPQLYDAIFQYIRDDADLRERWRDLADQNARCLLTYLNQATPTEFAIEVERLLASDPDLKTFSPAELISFLQAWYRNGDKLSMIEAAGARPEWQKIGWSELSRAYASLGDFRPAYDLLARYSTPGSLPDVTRIDYGSLVQRFKVSGDSGRDGLLLAVAQWQRGAADDALRTIEIARAAKAPPAELDFLASEIWAAKGDWHKAWESRAKFAKIL